MGKSKYILFVGVLLISASGFTQSSSAKVGFTLIPTLNGQTLMPGSRFFSPSHRDTIQIDKLKFYLSNVFLHNDTGEKVQVGDHYLFDLEKSNELEIEMDDVVDFFMSEGKGYSQLSFCVGVDSLVNESGAQGGALDPMHGMYWTWNSGYINFKLEGRSTICPSRNHEFQLHIGGFMTPYVSIRQVVLELAFMPEVQDTEFNKTILFPIDELLSKIDLSQQHTIMSPSKESMVIADLFSQSFKIKTLK